MTLGFILILAGALLDSGSINAWGLALIFPGMGLRLYCALYIGAHSNGNHLHSNTLITNGPYRWSRNPLYLSNGLVSFGILIFSGVRSIFLVSVILFILFILMALLVDEEEKHLSRIHGDTYQDYCRHTPRWLPNWSSLRPPGGSNKSLYAASRGQWFNLVKPLLAIILILIARYWT